jgi:phosphoribosylformylglycinamidine synthase
MDVKRPGDIVYLLGTTGAELGGSEYFTLLGFVGNRVPKVDAPRAYRRYQAYHRAVMAGTVASCHDLSDGGLAVAAAETAFAGGFGLDLDLGKVLWHGAPVEKNDLAILFSESASRLLITVRADKQAAFEEAMAGTGFSAIGTVTDAPLLTIRGIDGSIVVKAGLAELKTAWQAPLRDL